MWESLPSFFYCSDSLPLKFYFRFRFIVVRIRVAWGSEYDERVGDDKREYVNRFQKFDRVSPRPLRCVDDGESQGLASSARVKQRCARDEQRAGKSEELAQIAFAEIVPWATAQSFRECYDGAEAWTRRWEREREAGETRGRSWVGPYALAGFARTELVRTRRDCAHPHGPRAALVSRFIPI